MKSLFLRTKRIEYLNCIFIEILQKMKSNLKYLFSYFLISTFLITNAQKANTIPTTFTKNIINPILSADSNFSFFCPMKQQSVKWQKADVFNPAAIVKDGKVMLLFRAEDNPKAHLGGRTSRIGLAESTDGVHFTCLPEPVLYPANDNFSEFDNSGGCEDPRVVQTASGLYIIAYTAWNYDTPRLSIAFSKDLKNWQKKGPAFAKAYNGKYKNIASKSASIITKYKNGKYIVAKINGKYWMYWGENGVNLAWSENLFDWYPSEDKVGKLAFVITPRDKKFDSHLTECGPPAIITKKGVELIYNGRNIETEGKNDTTIQKGTYTVGKVIFDTKTLKKVIFRSEKPFLEPSLPHELTGQYKAGTCFAEGLIYFKNKWFLYYGTADSFVGLAVSK
jgi:beta-1,2-mannosidase